MMIVHMANYLPQADIVRSRNQCFTISIVDPDRVSVVALVSETVAVHMEDVAS